MSYNSHKMALKKWTILHTATPKKKKLHSVGQDI